MEELQNNKLYKMLKIRMKDFEEKEQEITDDNGDLVYFLKGKKVGQVKKKTVKTHVLKIITKDNEYKDKNKEVKIFQSTVINRKNVRQYHTLVKESELIRIIKALELDNNSEVSDNFIFIKDIISVAAKVNVYKEEIKDKIILSYQKLDKDGNVKVDSEGKQLIKEVNYKRLMASSGNVRNKKVIFVREELWKKANEILLCGLPNDMEYPKLSKFNAYYALPSTDSIPVTTPRIVVVDDYSKDITETFDVVRLKMDKEGKKVRDEYTCKAEPHIETIKPFDGAGLVDISLAKVWAKELGLYEEIKEVDNKGKLVIKYKGYIPSYFQFRAIPGVKGNTFVIDIKKYTDKLKEQGQEPVVIDAYGNKIEILDKEGNLIKNVILTKSQWKFYDRYKKYWGSEGFVKWEKFFNTELHGYKRTFNIAKYGVDFKDIKKEVLLSYQPLQTLNFSDKQIKSLCEPTVKRIKKISTDVDEFLKFRGLVEEFEQEQNKKSNAAMPQYYKALAKNKELWNDKFIQSKVKEDIKGFKERSYKGGLICSGNYQVLIPDIFGLLEFAFGKEPEGCLKANEIYSRYWIANKQEKVDLIRFPHIANEHRLVNVVNPTFKDGERWLEYITEGIVTSMYDTNALAANSADYDGDKIMGVSQCDILKQLEDNRANTIVFVDDTADENEGADENVKIPKINDVDKLIETDVMGMSNDIGAVVNQISKLWSIIPESDEEEAKIQEFIKIMSVIGSLTIDFVKTGVKSPIPPSILQFLNDKKVKKPEFMKWKYTKQAKEERVINKNKKLLNKEEVELFGKTECTVNKISWYMQGQVKDIEIENDKKEGLDYKRFIKENNFNKRAEGYLKTLETMLELKKEEDKIGYLQNKDTDDFAESQDGAEQYAIFYQYAKNRLAEIVANKNYKLDKEKMLDYLIYIVTNEKDFLQYNNMNLLWNTWGKELTRRINNKKLLGKELDIDKINKKSQELKNKVDKKNQKKEKVFIEIFKESDKDVIISAGEIASIKEIKGLKNKKLALTLLTIEKFCKAYNKEFNIANNKNSVKMYNIYKLADINHKDIYNNLKSLIDSKVISINERDNGKVLNCKVNVDVEGEAIDVIKDVNEIKKVFKFIA